MAEPGLEPRQSGSRACGGNHHPAGSQGRSPGRGEQAPPRPEWPKPQEEVVICEQPCGPCREPRLCPPRRRESSCRALLCSCSPHSRQRTDGEVDHGGRSRSWLGGAGGRVAVAVAVGLTTRGCRRQRVMPGACGRQKALAVATDQLD